MMRRLAFLSVVLSVGSVGIAGQVAAHIAPDPSEAQAGATLTVGFTVEHGCEGSPTVGLEMRLPDGVTAATPEPAEGWTESIEDNVVAYTGGSLAPDVAGTFEITMTLPPTPDTTIYFPFVQRCEVGEIRWIAIPTGPDDELDEPAPAMDLVGPVVTTTAPAIVPTTDPTPVTTLDAGTDTTTTDTTTSDTTTSDTTEMVTDSTATSDDAADSSVPLVVTTVGDDSSNTGTIMFIVSVLAVLAVGGLAFVFARRGRAPIDDSGVGAA